MRSVLVWCTFSTKKALFLLNMNEVCYIRRAFIVAVYYCSFFSWCRCFESTRRIYFSFWRKHFKLRINTVAVFYIPLKSGCMILLSRRNRIVRLVLVRIWVNVICLYITMICVYPNSCDNWFFISFRIFLSTIKTISIVCLSRYCIYFMC